MKSTPGDWMVASATAAVVCATSAYFSPSHSAANGLLHNLKVALLDNVDIYGDCSEFNTRRRIEIEIVYLPLCT